MKLLSIIVGEPWWPEHEAAVDIATAVRKQKEVNVYICFLLFIQSRTPVLGMVSTQTHLVWVFWPRKLPHRHTQMFTSYTVSRRHN